MTYVIQAKEDKRFLGYDHGTHFGYTKKIETALRFTKDEAQSIIGDFAERGGDFKILRLIPSHV